MAQGATTTRVKVTNPTDIMDAGSRELLYLMLIEMRKQTKLLLYVLHATDKTCKVDEDELWEEP